VETTCNPSKAAIGKRSGNPYKNLFDSLAISKAGKPYLDKMGKYPVIFLTFKNIKELDWETTYRKIKKLILDEYSRHYYTNQTSRNQIGKKEKEKR
jgi:hypothetical protein